MPRAATAICLSQHTHNKIIARWAWFATMLVVLFTGTESFAADRQAATHGVADLRTAMRQLFEHASHEDALPLHAWYGARAYQPAWTKTGGLTARGKAAIAALENASREGLPPARYTLGVLKQARTTTELAALEVAISRALQTYLQDVRYGAANPDAPAMGLQTLTEASTAPSLSAYIASQRPTNPRYGQLRQSLKTTTLSLAERRETILALEKLRWEHGKAVATHNVAWAN